MSRRSRRIPAALLAACLFAGGCSTVVVRTPRGDDVGTEVDYTERAYVFGLYRNPFRALLLPLDVGGAVTSGRTSKAFRLGARAGKRATRGGGNVVTEDYAFSEVCIESTIGDWFMRIITFGLYWPSTVTVWVVD